MLSRVLLWALFFLILLFALAAWKGQSMEEPQSEYQKCMSAITHADRLTDVDRREWEQSVCRNTPADSRDWK